MVKRKYIYLIFSMISITVFLSALYISYSTKIVFNQKIVESYPDNLNRDEAILTPIPEITGKDNNENMVNAEIGAPVIVNDEITSVTIALGKIAIVRVSDGFEFISSTENLRYHKAEDKGSFQTYPYVTGLAIGKGILTLKVNGSELNITVNVTLDGKEIQSDITNPDLSGDRASIEIDIVNLKKELLGKSEEKGINLLREKGIIHRISERDGEIYPLTMDYSANRVNLKVENGIITEMIVG